MKLTEELNKEYENVKETETDTIKGITDNSAVQEIYKSFTIMQKRRMNESIPTSYESCRQIIALNVGEFYSNDITQFCLLVYANDQEIKNLKDFGLFCSALINAHYEHTKQTGEYHLVLPITDKKLPYIGIYNAGSEILITGDCGNYLGSEMQSGKISVTGSVGERAGHMLKGGKIIIMKDVGIETGLFMKNGNLQIFGNAKRGLGYHMIGGRIDVEGTLEDKFISIDGGEIYHRGKRIFRNTNNSEEELDTSSLFTIIKNFLRGRK